MSRSAKAMFIGAALGLLGGSSTVSAGPVDDAFAALSKADFASALQILRPLAEQGNPAAESLLGEMYEGGVGLPRDATLAASWARKAADQGYAEGQYNLGRAYLAGLGVPQDHAEGLRWVRMAAAQHSANAEFVLGELYQTGDGVPQSDVQAISWWRKAAAQGSAPAERFLSGAYADGKGVRKDAATAVSWLRKAADQGDAEAQAQLGDAYRQGVGVPRDPVEAIGWYRKALAQSSLSVEQLFNLGLMLENGVGAPKDYKEAYTRYSQAANLRYAPAMASTAQMFANGQVFSPQEPPNYIQAYVWSDLATTSFATDVSESLDRALKTRDFALSKMTTVQRLEAQRQERALVQAPYGDRLQAMMTERGNAKTYAILCETFGASAGRLAPGSTLQQFTLNLGLKRYPDDATIVEWCQDASEAGDPYSQYLLADMYMNGGKIPLVKDNALGIKWLRRAADQNDPISQSLLGVIYYAGYQIPHDYVQAYKWFQLSYDNLGSLEPNKSERADDARSGADRAAADTIHMCFGDLLAKMTPAQIEEAQRLAREWEPSTGTQ